MKTNWAAEIQNYVSQMSLPDNVVKLEVLSHLNASIGKCLQAWQDEVNADRLKLAQDAGLVPKS